jgi:hypothetical protein
VLSLILLFTLGGFLLTRVNIDEGKRIARREDEEYLKVGSQNDGPAITQE